MSAWLHALSWRWRARRFRRAPRLPVILLYHSINERTHDPLQLTVHPGTFAAHLEWIAQHTTPLPLAEFVRRHQSGNLPADALALTFDDGYADNVTIAEPLLQRWGFPATLFVATDYIDSAREGWWDELDAIFLETPQLPSRFQSEPFACDVESQSDPTRGHWTVGAPPTTQRERAFLAASAWARGLDRPTRERFLQALRDWSRCPTTVRPECRFASWSELQQAQQRGTLTIGAHTRSHPALALLPPAEQRREITESCDLIRARLKTEPDGFAYPFGSYHDFSLLTRTITRECRLPFACANLPAHFRPGLDAWQLPRVLVRDWSVADLAARLSP